MAANGTVLVIDDEPVLQDVLGSLLKGDGFDYLQATTATDGFQILREEEVDVVLLDLMLPDRSGLELLPDIKEFDPHLPVVVITAYSSVESAIEAMRRGAFHYVPKPFKNEEVLHLVRRAAERRALLVENLELRTRLEGMGEIVGTSRRIEEVFELMRRAAPARSTILVVGESGTGKELVARAIHRLSPRGDGPFVPVHTSARFPRTSWNRPSSAMSRAPSPELSARARGCSRQPITGPSFSTKLGPFHRKLRPSFCA
jgi:DNA-binding NtrC family response regulator